MSIDHFHFVAKGKMPVEIDRAEAATKLTEEAHTIYVIEHLYIFENGETAAALFERWRRQPVEKIIVTLDGVEQVGERLPVNSVPDMGCDVDISWDGDFDTDGDPNGPARWKVRCGQPAAGEVMGRPFCQRHLALRPAGNR
jgi:hypothetical protein